MRAQVVVLLAEAIQSWLRIALRMAASTAGLFERPMEALDLALRLRMADAGEVEPDADSHQPHAQLRPAAGGLRVPPRLAVIHQHRLGQPAVREGPLQSLLDVFAAARGQLFEHDHVAAMIVQHTQRAEMGAPSLGTLEVHLPQLVGCGALEAAGRGGMSIERMQQTTALEHTVNGHARYGVTFAGEQHGQLAGTPLRVPL